MKNFDSVLLRLKQELKVTADQDVASTLGITKAAFAERKRRDVFPEDKLMALSARRPELNLDVTYVLAGERTTAWQRNQLAETAKVVKKLEPDGGPITENMQNAYKKAGAVRKAPEYAALQEVLDHCKPADLELLKAMAIWMAKK